MRSYNPVKGLNMYSCRKQTKKIDISIPKLDNFIHKVYINVARKTYSNVYLFDKNISPLQIQKNTRELEQIIQECILISIRDSIPTEAIIRAYMDESVEQEEEVIIEDIPEEEVKEEEKKEEEVKEEKKEEEEVPSIVPSIQNVDEEEVVTKLSFNDMDAVLDEQNELQTIEAPKSIERLEELSTERAIVKRLEEESDDDDERIKISTENINLDGFDDLTPIQRSLPEQEKIILNDVEELY